MHRSAAVCLFCPTATANRREHFDVEHRSQNLAMTRSLESPIFREDDQPYPCSNRQRQLSSMARTRSAAPCELAGVSAFSDSSVSRLGRVRIEIVEGIDIGLGTEQSQFFATPTGHDEIAFWLSSDRLIFRRPNIERFPALRPHRWRCRRLRHVLAPVHRPWPANCCHPVRDDRYERQVSTPVRHLVCRRRSFERSHYVRFHDFA